MKQIRKIPTGPIPDGYYTQEWSLEGAILRDKINEIIDSLQENVPVSDANTDIPRSSLYKAIPTMASAIRQKPEQITPMGTNAQF